MNAPLVWIALPGLLAAAGFLLRRWQRAVTVTLAIFALLLALAARFAPVEELVVIGPWAFTFSERFAVAGRQFVLGGAQREMLIVVYLTLGFFFIGALPAEVSDWFAPLGMGMAAVLVASLAVQPFLYAALFIQVAVLLGVPLLAPPGAGLDRSVLRYLTFLSLGMPFLLFAGWQLSILPPDATDPAVLLLALTFLGIGFAFLLAIFPLNAWIPMLTGGTHPYGAAFVITLLPLTVTALLLRFLAAYPWLLEFEVLQFSGVLMVVTGGLWAAFQRDLGRLLGVAVIIEIGRALLAVSHPAGLPIYAAMLAPRVLATGVWALSLARLRRATGGDLSFRALQGMARTHPVLALGALAGIFSLAGFPFLAGFPVQLALWGQVAQVSLSAAVWTVLGSAGLLVGGIRSLAVLVMGPEEMPPAEPAGRMGYFAWGLILIGVLGLVLLGVLV